MTVVTRSFTSINQFCKCRNQPEVIPLMTINFKYRFPNLLNIFLKLLPYAKFDNLL